jgi:predicted anti-sigma-YlaC factor YlaD
LVLDREASAEDMAYVKSHLETCTHCLDCYETDKTLKEALKTKISKKCPNALMDCIKEKILSSNV